MKVKMICLITDNNNCIKCETKKKISKIKNKKIVISNRKDSVKGKKKMTKNRNKCCTHRNYNNCHDLSHSNNAGEWCVKDVNKCYHILVDQRFWLVVVGKNR